MCAYHVDSSGCLLLLPACCTSGKPNRYNQNSISSTSFCVTFPDCLSQSLVVAICTCELHLFHTDHHQCYYRDGAIVCLRHTRYEFIISVYTTYENYDINRCVFMTSCQIFSYITELVPNWCWTGAKTRCGGSIKRSHKQQSVNSVECGVCVRRKHSTYWQ